MNTTCVRTYATEDDANRAVNVLRSYRIVGTASYSDFVEKWCVKVPTDDARAAYHFLKYSAA